MKILNIKNIKNEMHSDLSMWLKCPNMKLIKFFDDIEISLNA